jgi:hypothetical protein
VSGEREEREKRERERERELFFLDFTKQNKTEQTRKKMKDRNLEIGLPVTLVTCFVGGKLYMCPIVLLGYLKQ